MSEQSSAKETAERTAAVSFAEISSKRRGPFRRFFHAHPVAMDWVLILATVLFGLPNALYSVSLGEWLPLGLLAAVSAALAFRRRFPWPVLAVATAVDILTVLATSTGASSIGVWVAVYTLATTVRAAVALAVAVAAGLLVLAAMGIHMPAEVAESIAAGELPPYVGLVSGVIIVLFNVISAGIGVTVRRDRLHDLELHRWAADNAMLASANERTRIAREMHDVVAHSLSVMVALSDGAAVVVKKDPHRAGEVLGQLSATGRTALADMRRVLGVLREGGTQPQAPRVPAESEVAELIEGFRAAGLPLKVVMSGPPLPEDPNFKLTAYRIIQESLTNVLRYARGMTEVELTVARSDGRVSICVSDDGRPPANMKSLGAGQGIAGMRERAAIYNGQVECGPRPNGGWIVEATLHWPGEEPAHG
ncbi:sensor histidine kinase [Arthrobacter crystallopoietes BAB-32]|uniref:histidine kinase n=1 Tax=Arthrobacter crystallopoietes BAB-32 TaxID=1246476 RepID=N1V396_9MICC|nr:histidine kinase [Arthrobacter crystallopoietes]EMY32713.1 sensor histidine kinase [Arthrobacter crystallopoietes BAB-32]